MDCSSDGGVVQMKTLQRLQQPFRMRKEMQVKISVYNFGTYYFDRLLVHWLEKVLVKVSQTEFILE